MEPIMISLQDGLRPYGFLLDLRLTVLEDRMESTPTYVGDDPRTKPHDHCRIGNVAAKDEYERLRRITEENRMKAEQGRLNMERHVVDHRC
jgi:hypothetical protein